MGGSEPPYLYDAPKHRPVSYPYSNYDPKQVTRQSRERFTEDKKPMSTQHGPLIDFNRHPDSYMIVTGSKLEHEPLASNTKKAVTAIRWTQFSFRVIELFVAMGSLFCAIVLKPSDLTQAWIMRITPGYDLLLLAYALYHLLRSSKARTPSSSASYHFFALLMDVALIPFYGFTAVFTFSEYRLSDTDFSWTSFFPLLENTRLICFLAFIAAATLGGLHLISMAFDLYLTVIFRKIASLPPDMNPLEDNLTSRKSSKHKYKNSELSLDSTIQEKKAGFYSGTTFNGSFIDNNGSRPSTANGKDTGVRQIEFAHSRMNSDFSFSPHNPDSARLSRQQLEQEVYRQSRSARQSAQSIARPQSSATLTSNHVRHDVDSDIARQKKSMLNDNWYVLDDEADAGRLEPPSPARQAAHLPAMYAVNENPTFIHEPLGMNPPTPSPDRQQLQKSDRNVLNEVSINRSLTVTSDNTVASSVYSESAPSLQSNKVRSTPKGKYYGDLAAAARAVRGYSQLPQADEVGIQTRSPKPGQRQDRVISRSGADVADENSMFAPEKSSRRRMISGKAAEEGLGGYWR